MKTVVRRRQHQCLSVNYKLSHQRQRVHRLCIPITPIMTQTHSEYSYFQIVILNVLRAWKTEMQMGIVAGGNLICLLRKRVNASEELQLNDSCRNMIESWCNYGSMPIGNADHFAQIRNLQKRGIVYRIVIIECIGNGARIVILGAVSGDRGNRFVHVNAFTRATHSRTLMSSESLASLV